MATKKSEDGVVHLSDKEVADAQKEGQKQAIADAVSDGFVAIDGSLPGEMSEQNKWHGWEESQPYAYILNLGIDAFEKRVSVDAGKDEAVPDNMVYGLLALERNGQNRTPYVKAMMKRLGLKADQLPGGGPSYTNDLTNITDL